ncbi:cytochrome c550 [Gracilibacillus ureilyticus]|uniref:Cytochrome c550 n=1 Tax=Gracilibacillus ureilyticus TaxID=531814 RepID=A0A1H9M1H5_9BACI|nr:cytochrome c [Gracilibacillus ureilyticus]SER17530.1 cytochrome c550 [Gracilibacillus ureilyticus]
MKKNPVIPFALIAVLGIVAMIVLSVIGLDEQDRIANGGEEGETVNTDPEAIAQSCIGCHGGDLEGASAPSLQNLESKYSVEEVEDIINNGIEGTAMQGGIVPSEEAAILAEWLVTGETGEAAGESEEAAEEEGH